MTDLKIITDMQQIPTFATEAEEADFWATHALAEHLLSFEHTGAMSCARAVGLAAEDIRINNAASGKYTGLDKNAIVNFDPKSCAEIVTVTETAATATAPASATAGATKTGGTFDIALSTNELGFLGTIKHPNGKTTYYITSKGLQAGGTAPNAQ